MKKDDNIFCRCLYYSANALARNLTKMAEKEFADTGWAPSYGFVLMAVNREPGITIGKLAKMLMLTPSTITRLVDKLEKKDMVKRITEGRSMLVFPTKASVALNDALQKAWGNLYKKYVELLGETFAVDLTNQIYESVLKLEK